MSTTAIQQRVFSELQTLEPDKWFEVLDFVSYLKYRSFAARKSQDHSKELTARDLLESGLVGIWANRDDIGDSLEFARQLRHRAEHRCELADVAS